MFEQIEFGSLHTKLVVLTGAACDGDLAGLLGLLPEANHLTRHVQIGEVVQLEQLLDVVLVVLEELAQVQATGVVDEHVDVLEVPLDLLEFALDQLLIRHIEIGDENVVLGQLAGELCSRQNVSVVSAESGGFD